MVLAWLFTRGFMHFREILDKIKTTIGKIYLHFMSTIYHVNIIITFTWYKLLNNINNYYLLLFLYSCIENILFYFSFISFFKCHKIIKPKTYFMKYKP